MGRSIEHDDFDRHYPQVAEFQMAVRQAARRALRHAEHDTEREAIRSALVRAGNLRTVSAKLYTDGPAQPTYIRGHRKTDRKGNTYHRVEIADLEGNLMWESPITYGGDIMYAKTAWKWLIASGYVPENSSHIQHRQFGISMICGDVMGKGKL